jgi:hypothetical protein
VSNDHVPKQEHAPDNGVEHEHDPARDAGSVKPEGSKPLAPMLKSSAALTSIEALKALGTLISKVDNSALTRTFAGHQLLLFHSREGGLWTYGQKHTAVEAGSSWTVNVLSFEWGWVCFGADRSKPPIDEKLVPFSEPKPEFAKLPDRGFPWTEERAVNLKCHSGVDAGLEVTFKSNAHGGRTFVDGLYSQVCSRHLSGLHGDKVVPIGTLEKDSYPHKDYGKIWTPVFGLSDWTSFDNPPSAPAPTPPKPTPPVDEQPRRRKVAA